MTKSSTATVRQAPVADVSTTGRLRVHAETIEVRTAERVQLVDITDRVMERVRQCGIEEGMVSVCSLHTTCAVMINENQVALQADIQRFLEELVDRDAGWAHNDASRSDCERANADSHLRAMLLGHTVTLQISGGEAVLGHWQRILAAELDGPRTRTFRVQAMGIAA